MNLLAHAYLSFNNPEILVGNMISDYVKGKKKFDYPIGIQNGIQLHRLIDQFTDAHPMTKRAKIIFSPHYGLYSGALGYFTPTGDFDFNVVIRSILYNSVEKYISFSV